MKKIFFVFAMLLMSITSALAEESRTFYTYERGNKNNPSYNQEPITVSGQYADASGLYISDGRRIKIETQNGEIITKVEFVISWGEGIVGTTAGVLENNFLSEWDETDGVINDVNANSLEIFSNVSGDDFQIDEITVHFEPVNSGNNNEGGNGGSNENVSTFVMDEYVQTESFSIGYCNGRNVTITGQGTGGFDIANGKDVNITAGDHVKILKVDLELIGSYNDSPISSPWVAVGSGYNWTVNNVNSSSLTISGTGNDVKIKNIKVYYVELSESEYTEFFNVDGKNSCSGKSVSIVGTENNNYDMELANGNSVTITANSGIEISKLDLHFAQYQPDFKMGINSTSGDVEGSGNDWTVNNINSSSLTLSHPGIGDVYEVQIGTITVHYKEKIAPATIELVANKVKDDYGATYYWTTFYSNASNYQAPEGTQVFKVNLSGVDITMTEIEDRIVTKGQGVVLKSTNSNIEMSRTDSESSDGYSGNSLLGTSVSITNPGNAYVLSYSQSKGVGFYKLSDTGTIGINKAYLVYDGSASARSFFTFEEAATGIEMNKIGDNEGDDKVYDLQGRRVVNPSNGIYIVNGKKVIMNKR